MNPTAHPFDRRRFLAGVAATSALAAFPARAAMGAPQTALGALLDTFADELLAQSPEQATGLGLDTGARAGLKSMVSDLSPAGVDRWTAQVTSIKQRLGALDRTTLSADDRIRYDTINYSADRGLEGTKFGYGGGAAAGFGGGTGPYVVSQQSGVVSGFPEFLNSQHSIATKADAEAYLARMVGFARQIDQEAVQITSDASRGIVPPNFIARNALGQLTGFRATKAASQGLVSSLLARTSKAGIAGEWGSRATKLIEAEIYPALDRQIAAFAAATADAGDNGSVARLPDGEAYYRWALRLGTTTTKDPAEIHATGLEQNQEILARMDGLLRSQGLTQGSVGARVTALNRDTRFLYPDTDVGREALLADIGGRIAAIRPLLPKLSHMALKADVQVKRVPPDIQDGSALGYMNFASLDGSRPAIYYVNLKSTSLWPKYQLASLTAHEAVPGHAWQGAYLAEKHYEIPLIASMIGFNAFVEGWALYAEQLVDEFGIYANDPFSQLGYLQAQQFRACRLVVDTGLHAMGWSRDKAVQFLISQTGKGVEAMTSEIDRYCASPGQACGYKIGHNEILRLRAKSQSALGHKFDLAAFNDVVVQTGGVPLAILETVIDAHIARGIA